MNKFRLAGWLAVGGLLGAALLAPTAALATQPAPDHKVTICHRTDSNTNPYNENTVDIASSGHLQGGHDTQHEGPIWNPTLKSQKIEWGDIIPPYTYGDFSYAGQNWTDEGAAILRAGCVIEGASDDPSEAVETQAVESQPVETEPVESTPVETEPAESEPVETEPAESQPVETEPVESTPVESVPVESVPVESVPVESVPVESVPVVTPCADCAPATHTVPEGSVEAETGTPNEDVTPPSTDTLTPTNATPSSDGWQLVLIALAALMASALVLTPATRRVRR